ncbi:MAG: hypothetical protein OHK0053_29630 [Microscillaceae bacterium]
MKRFTFLLIWLATLLAGGRALAQSPLLDQYVAEGLRSNLALQRQHFEIQKSLAALEEARGLYYPQVSFLASYTLAKGGRNIAIPVGDLLNSVYSTLNQLTDSQQFPQISNVSEQFLPNNFHETKFRVIQPLFNSDIYFGYKARQEQVSVEEAKKATYEQELAQNIRIAYFQYLQTLKVLEIYEETEGLLQEVLRVNQKLVKNQKATAEVIYGAEYELEKLHRDQAEALKNRQSSQAYFNFLLNRDLNAEIEVDTSLRAREPVPAALRTLEDQALQDRAELNQIKTAVSANQALLRLNENHRLPTLNVVGDVGFQGFGYTFDREQDFWLLQFALQWDLFKGRQNRRKIQQNQIQIEQLNTQYTEVQNQIRLQVHQAYFARMAAQESLRATEAGLKSAAQNFFLTRRKYEEGLALYVELVEARTSYTQARLEQALAEYALLMREAELGRAMGAR